ncbi:MAG: hypothetical protein ABF709_05160 [Leuconostoc pseudomesenteroides]|nr:hypothetical protein [Leuconostoc pseudomesenteroides]
MTKNGLQTQHDLANAIGVIEAVLSIVINDYAVNKRSREVREKVKQLLDI